MHTHTLDARMHVARVRSLSFVLPFCFQFPKKIIFVKVHENIAQLHPCAFSKEIMCSPVHSLVCAKCLVSTLACALL